MSPPYTALIVDDEALARSNLSLALAEHPGWRCAGLCASAAEARVALAERPVDLLLLDIQMPRQNGLALAGELCKQPGAPLIVFVTAYDEHALAAFEVFALDYLLKPFDDARFAAMLARVEQMLALQQRAAYAQALGGFLGERERLDAGEPPEPLESLTVRSTGALERVSVADIEWIAAAGNYVELHLRQPQGRVVLHRSTLSAVEERLSAQEFLRVHRTTLVRRSALTAITVTGDGTYTASLQSGDQVPVSERYIKAVRSLF